MKALLLAVWLVPSARAVDCADPYILARRVPECADANALQDAERLVRMDRDARAALGRVSADFDGARARSGEPEAVRGGASATSLAPAPELPQARPSPVGGPYVPVPSTGKTSDEEEEWEDILAWGAEALYHTTWALDLWSTIQILKKGGYEMNPIYTLFGKTSLAGVVISIVAVHLLGTWAARWAYRRMKASQGEARKTWQRLLLFFLLLGAGSHLYGFIHNRGVLRRWKG